MGGQSFRQTSLTRSTKTGERGPAEFCDKKFIELYNFVENNDI
jgi:hypothetical protein